ncbi:MAG TPA: c-type cytochrome [Vicinamibacterales bacterium]
MRTARSLAVAIVIFACAAWSAKASAERPAQSPSFGVGRGPTPAELSAIDIEVLPDGRGLPAGRSTAAAGKDVYTRRCLTCHGPTGVEGPQDVLVGGRGSLASLSGGRPLKTVGSYWPYATTLWDYVRRAMPFDHPGTLSTGEVYGATAYLLFLNGIVSEEDVLNESTLPKVKMPNRDGFVPDTRPDVPSTKTEPPKKK